MSTSKRLRIEPGHEVRPYMTPEVRRKWARARAKVLTATHAKHLAEQLSAKTLLANYRRAVAGERYARITKAAEERRKREEEAKRKAGAP